MKPLLRMHKQSKPQEINRRLEPAIENVQTRSLDEAHWFCDYPEIVAHPISSSPARLLLRINDSLKPSLYAAF